MEGRRSAALASLLARETGGPKAAGGTSFTADVYQTCVQVIPYKCAYIGVLILHTHVIHLAAYTRRERDTRETRIRHASPARQRAQTFW